ncbi:8008_t:CDS:2, partial [Gigaspora margarita]
PIISDFVIFEVTDIDFITSNVIVVQNAQLSITLNISEYHSDIDIIAENTDSNILWAVKRPQRLTPRLTDTVQIQKNKNKLSDLALNILELSTVNIEDAPENNDEFEILEETVIEEVPKK